MDCILCQKKTEQLSLSKACIKGYWIFGNLEPSDREALGQLTQRELYLPGQLIFRQGELANRMLIIKRGRIRLWKVTEKGDEITLDIRQSGDVLGESMFNQDGVIPVNATCLEETSTCGLLREDFERLVLTNPKIGLQVIKNLSQRIDFLINRVEDMSYSNLEERLYRILVTVAQEHGRKGEDGITLPMPLTHEELSFLVGAHRVSITRALKVLENSGQVLRKGKFLMVCPQVSQ